MKLAEAVWTFTVMSSVRIERADSTVFIAGVVGNFFIFRILEYLLMLLIFGDFINLRFVWDFAENLFEILEFF